MATILAPNTSAGFRPLLTSSKPESKAQMPKARSLENEVFPWPHVRKIVDDGATLEIHGGGHHLDIASLYADEQLVCMFRCGRMKFNQIMDHLEELAKRYIGEGM